MAWTDYPDRNLYIDEDTGETLTYDETFDLIDEIIDYQGDDAAETLAEMVADGTITVEEWQRSFGDVLKWLYLILAALAFTGTVALFDDDFRKKLEATLREQYGYLVRFALEIAAGAVIGGALLRRMRMYVNGSRQAFWMAWDEKMKERGFTEERWEAIGDKNTCSSCSDADMRGWVKIGTFGQPGSGIVEIRPTTTLCEGLTQCRCRKAYRRT